MKKLICILGASGSGKTTLCEDLMTKFNLKQIPSYTTRLPRYEGEVGHIFISAEEFKQLDLVAYAQTTGAEYGVTLEQIDNEEYTLYVVDFTGLKTLTDTYKGEREIVSVFIDCPLKHRYERLVKRSGIDTALQRLVHDAVEFKDAKEVCDYYINNADGCYSNALAKLIGICCEEKVFGEEKV